MSKRRCEFQPASFDTKRRNTSEYDPKLDTILVKLEKVEERLDCLTKGNQDMYIKIAQIKRDTNEIQAEFHKKYLETMRVLEILCQKIYELSDNNEMEFQIDETPENSYFL